jgi:L-rhamnose mutarotase
MTRHASVLMLRPEKEVEYRTLHQAVWPEVVTRLRSSNISNFSIYFRDGLLVSYFEYWGDDYDADMAAIAADPTTKRWWELTAPCQEPISTAAEGELWAPMEELFHAE